MKRILNTKHNEFSVETKEEKLWLLVTSCARENGMMIRPRLRSANARDAMNQFCTVFRLCSVAMAMMTSMLPTTTMIIMMVIMMDRMMISVVVY